MKVSIVATTLLFGLLGSSCTTDSTYDLIENEETVLSATGTFEVNLTPQEDIGAPAGRMLINKTYHGDMVGSGVGQMLSKRTDSGTAAYYAIEEFTGSVNGKKGRFTLLHSGSMSKNSETLDIVILQGSGSDELRDVSGSMSITQDDNGHRYELALKGKR